MQYDYLNMIVPASVVESVRALALTFPSTTGMWTVPLCQKGGTDIVAYISSGAVETEIAQLLPLKEYVLDVETGETVENVIRTGNPADIVAKANEAGMPITEAQISAIFSVCDISTQGAFEALDRLGLELKQDQGSV